MAHTFHETELLERVDNDVEFLAETVGMLAEDGPTLIDQLRAAVAAGDAPAVAKHAHSMKGMISNFCAAEAQASALDLEKIGKSSDLSPASRALETLASHVAALTGELTEFIKARA